MGQKSVTEYHFTVEQALKNLPGPQGKPFCEVFTHGTLTVELYQPVEVDRQTPHTRDEVYVVIQGEGKFMNGGTTHAFGPGDVLFVPAGVEHRFEDFSDDFLVWVFFYGPEGGEFPE